jgi:hypothetical protein
VSVERACAAGAGSAGGYGPECRGRDLDREIPAELLTRFPESVGKSKLKNMSGDDVGQASRAYSCSDCERFATGHVPLASCA